MPLRYYAAFSAAMMRHCHAADYFYAAVFRHVICRYDIFMLTPLICCHDMPLLLMLLIFFHYLPDAPPMPLMHERFADAPRHAYADAIITP